MTQVLIYSINPEHVLNFLNGKKTIEVRKRDLPQWALDIIKSGGVVQGYGYCTKGGKRLSVVHDDEDGKTRYYINSNWGRSLNGDVVFKFQVSGVTLFEFIDGNLTVKYDNEAQLLGKVYMLNEQSTQLTYEQLFKYIGNNNGYAHHFTNITPIDPMELREFTATTIRDDAIIEKDMGGNEYFYYKDRMAWRFYFGRLSRPPQSFMTAWVKGE